jgi:ABC-2 type transport system permease protein
VSLLHAEWNRFFARRFVRIMLGIIVVLLAIIAIGTGHNSQKHSPAVYAKAQARATAEAHQIAQQLSQCEAAQASGTAGPDSPYMLPQGATCQDLVNTGGETPQASWFLPETWVFADKAGEMMVIFGVIFALFGFAVGASYVGAEWSSGGMANLLLWRPRRLAVLGGKLGALLVSVFASGLLFLVAWLLMLSGIAAFRGSFGHITSGLITSIALATSRSFGLGLALAAIGFAVASIGRNTASALGIAVGYIVVFEAGGTVIARLANIDRPERFLLSRYVAAWLAKSEQFSSQPICAGGPGGFVGNCDSTSWYMRMGSAAEVLGIITVALLSWAFIAMRRRDIT